MSRAMIIGLFALMTIATSTGCETSIGGGSLPASYDDDDDVQYFPAGPEVKLSREEAAEEEFKAQNAQRDSDAAP